MDSKELMYVTVVDIDLKAMGITTYLFWYFNI